MSARASFAVVRGGSIPIVAVTGEVDLDNAAGVRDGLLALVDHDDRGLAVDVNGTRYIDSTGVAALYEVLRALHRRDQHLVLVAAPDARVRRLLAITGFDQSAIVVDDTAAIETTLGDRSDG